MPVLFKETIGKQGTVELSTFEQEVFVFVYKDGDYTVSKYDLDAPGLEHALATYNHSVGELFQLEQALAEEEGFFDDGYEANPEEE